VNEWLKKAVLLYFRMKTTAYQRRLYQLLGQVASKFATTNSKSFRDRAAFAGAAGRSPQRRLHRPSVVLMPSYVNIGGYVDEGSMVDTWATVRLRAHRSAECASFRWCRYRRRAGTVQAAPTIIEDNCFHRRAL